MADYDQLFAPKINDLIHTVSEIPKGSINKIEFDRDSKVFVLDRVEPTIFAKPVNYGFIPGTLDDDGDALDTLILTDEPIPTGVVVRARVVGILNFVDGGENDHKILCVPEDDRNSGDRVKTFADIPEQVKNQIVHHFSHYKDLKKLGTTEVKGWGDENDAMDCINQCIESYAK